MRRSIARTLTLAALLMFPIFHGCGFGESDPAAVIEKAGKVLDSDPDKAISILQKYDERKPGNPQIAEQLAFAWSQKGDQKQAAFYFEKVAQLDPTRQDALLFAAQSLQQAGDVEGAMSVYQQYLTAKPDDIVTCLTFAALADSTGRTDIAIGQYNYAFTHKPSCDIAIALGNLYLKKNDAKQAAQWFEKALKDFPECQQAAQMGLLDAYMRSQNYAKADAVAAKIKKDFPGVIEASASKDAPDIIAQWKEKKAAEKKASDAKKKQAESKIVITRADGSLVDTSASTNGRKMTKAEAVALEEQREAEADAAANVVALPAPAPAAAPAPKPVPAPIVAVVSSELDKAREVRKSGNLEDAAKLYRALLAKNPSAAAWNDYSKLSMDMGNKEQALAASLEATRMEPGSLDYAVQYLTVAQAVYDSRRLMSEIVSMKKRFPDSPVITLALARAYWEVEKNAGMARAMYDEYLSKAPKNAATDAVRKERDSLPAGY
jgi:tetratricopeptide (TPR) repeat protein